MVVSFVFNEYVITDAKSFSNSVEGVLGVGKIIFWGGSSIFVFNPIFQSLSRGVHKVPPLSPPPPPLCASMYVIKDFVIRRFVIARYCCQTIISSSFVLNDYVIKKDFVINHFAIDSSEMKMLSLDAHEFFADQPFCNKIIPEN
jgi:hypothetical protein